jgi:serine/threonine protein kinase
MVKTMASFTEGDDLYIVRELMDLGDLGELVKVNHSFFNYENVRCILYQIISAMLHIHKDGKIHRNLSTSNILINSQGKVKICGSALSNEMTDVLRGIKDKDAKSCTGSFVHPGARGSEDACNPLSDIWAVGIILLEMLFGSPENLDEKYLGLINSIINEDSLELDPADGISPLIPKEMRHFLRACFSKDPNDKPSSEELLNHRVFEDIDLARLEKSIQEDPEMMKIKMSFMDDLKITKGGDSNEQEWNYLFGGPPDNQIQEGTMKGRFFLQRNDSEVKSDKMGGVDIEGKKGNNSDDQTGSSSSEYKRGRFHVRISPKERKVENCLEWEVKRLMDVVELQRKQLKCLSLLVKSGIENESSTQRNNDGANPRGGNYLKGSKRLYFRSFTI